MEDVFWPQDGEVHHYLTVIIDPSAVFWFPLMDCLVLDQQGLDMRKNEKDFFNRFSLEKWPWHNFGFWTSSQVIKN